MRSVSNSRPGAGDSPAGGGRPRVLCGRGPRESEGLLLAELDRRIDGSGAELLARPIRIVVPSRSLRLHLLALLARRRGPLAGVECGTLHAMAELVVRAAGLEPAAPVDLFPVLSRRLAATDPGLRRSLQHLNDGYGAVVGSVRDLLDAGFGPGHLEAVTEALRQEGRPVASAEVLDRATSVVRIAAAAAGGLEELGLGRSSTLLSTAAALVRQDPEALPSTSALFVHGFSDATGVASDLLEALLVRLGGTIILDRPPDPARRGESDPGTLFTRRFSERMEAVTQTVLEPPGSEPPPVDVRMLQAAGRVAEVRAVVDLVVDLLAAGVPPETVGIVARDLEGYRLPLRTHLARAGVPFSGVGARGPLSPAGRRIRALLELVSRREAIAVERWLDARDAGFAGSERFELRLALHALGAGRLEEAATLRPDARLLADGLPIPVRQGLRSAREDDADDPEGRETRLERRRIPGAALAEALAAARVLARRFGRWRERRPLADHLADLRRLMYEDLAWRPERKAARAVEEALERGLDRLPPALELEPSELVLMLEDALAQCGTSPLGGAGGGVQVLDVTEARQRTFGHLFLLGLNRGHFPREVREDPVFPDSLRELLGAQGFGVLPDLATKRLGHFEESFLFAQLLSAAPSVTLLWRRADEKGSLQTPSSLLERIRWAERPAGTKRPRPVSVRSLLGPGGADEDAFPLRLYTAAEHAIAAGLRGGGASSAIERLGGVFSLALADALTDLADPDLPTPSALSRARLDSLEEWNGGRALRGALGPLFGFLGPRHARDPRDRDEIWITTLERYFRCPWKAFLERLLRLEPLPDPLEVLPGLNRLLIGRVVHRVAEAIAGGAGEREGERADLATIRELPARRVPWPGPEALGSLARSAADALVREEGLALPGFASVLARASLPFLESLERLDWTGPEGEPEILAAEIEGRWELPAGSEPRSLRFRADRADRSGDALRMTDYKTGSGVLSTAVKPATRRKHLLDRIGSGLDLQAAAYAVAGGDRALGRYLFLDPDLEIADANREAEVDAGDTELTDAFARAVSTGVTGWTSGVFVPKLVEREADEEPRTCDWCEVAQACVRGDSGLRGRLRRWLDAHRPEDRPEASEPKGGSAEAALVRLWWLGARERR